MNQILLILWIVVTSLGLLAAAAVLVWAVRRRQFSDQDRARYLPLDGAAEYDKTGGRPADDSGGKAATNGSQNHVSA